MALCVGLVNLFAVHWRKIKRSEKGTPYSVIVLISFAITLLMVAYFGPTAQWSHVDF